MQFHKETIMGQVLFQVNEDENNQYYIEQIEELLEDINNKISELIYSVWDTSFDTWNYYGSLNYFYDENNCFNEVTASYGYKTIYIYEKGHGNASLLYYPVMDFAEAEPILKHGIKPGQ